MADNLSSLIADAFAVYSESYTKIGELGSRIVDLDGSPLQPKKIKQLIACSRLFRVIEPSIILNDAGTAIVGVVGDIATMNNLLLKLKRCVGIYELPSFPTPLTEYIFNASDLVPPIDATYVTVSLEAALTDSRTLAVGSGLTLTDGGAQGNITLENTNSLSSLQVDTSINPVLNMAGMVERLFYGSVAITGTRSWSLSNTTNARRLQILFSISGLTPGNSTHDQTFPTAFEMSDARWNSATKVWRPIDDGEYEAIATTYDGVNWKLRIGDVYT